MPRNTCGAISQFVPPFNSNETGELQKSATGSATCNSNATLLEKMRIFVRGRFQTVDFSLNYPAVCVSAKYFPPF